VAVYRALMEAGKEWGVANAGYRAIDSQSIERGYTPTHFGPLTAPTADWSQARCIHLTLWLTSVDEMLL